MPVWAFHKSRVGTRGQAPRPVVTAEEAIRALDLALAVEQALADPA